MSLQDNANSHQDQDDDTGSSGGQSGHIGFVDFLTSADKSRDASLPPEEKRRLQAYHEDLHKEEVRKQKALRTERQAQKENKTTRQFGNDYGHANAGEYSPYKQNPILNCAQFSGATDKKVNPSPSENDADNNPELRAEAELQFRMRNEPQYTHQPEFNPKPSPP